MREEVSAPQVGAGRFGMIFSAIWQRFNDPNGARINNNNPIIVIFNIPHRSHVGFASAASSDQHDGRRDEGFAELHSSSSKL